MDTQRETASFSVLAGGGKRKRRLEDAEPSSETSDKAFQQKKVTTAPPFDVQRAESSRQHVRALNTQFASWIQKQLQDHPDELWQEGLQDYLKYASDIMAKFSDVVEWLRSNASTNMQDNSTNNLDVGFLSTDKKGINGESQSVLSNLEKDEQKNGGQVFPSASLSFGLQPSSQSAPASGVWSFGLSSFNQSSSTAGMGATGLSAPSSLLQIKTGEPLNAEDENGATMEKPSSPSVKRFEEPGTVVVHEVKSKLYVKSEDAADKGWKDKGMGHLYIKCKEGADRGTKEAKAKVEIRNDVGKLLLNALLYPNMKLSVQKKSITTFFYTADEETQDTKTNAGTARMYLIRVSSEEDAKRLEEAFLANAPSTN